jgi:hypothetical protein
MIAQSKDTKARRAITEQRVNVGHRQPGIGQRTYCYFGVNVPNGVMWKVSPWVFIDSGNKCCPANTH